MKKRELAKVARRLIAKAIRIARIAEATAADKVVRVQRVPKVPEPSSHVVAADRKSDIVLIRPRVVVGAFVF